MMSEYVNTLERDLGRARWMRGIGQIVFSQAADELFQDGPVVMPHEAKVERTIQGLQTTTGVDPLFARAHVTLNHVLQARNLAGEHDISDVGNVSEAIDKYTHVGQMHTVLWEAIASQVSLPLNLAQLISLTAEERGYDGFIIKSYADMGQTLLRPDFKVLIQTALFTRNGVWGSMSSDTGLPSDILQPRSQAPAATRIAKIVANGLLFTNSKVTFTDGFKKFLKDEVRVGNRYGDRGSSLVKCMSTSGCPVSHHRPHGVSSQDLEVLADHYQTTPDKLMKQRDRTVVEDGLSFMATILTNFEAYRSGEVSTYLSSAESPS